MFITTRLLELLFITTIITCSVTSITTMITCNFDSTLECTTEYLKPEHCAHVQQAEPPNQIRVQGLACGYGTQFLLL